MPDNDLYFPHEKLDCYRLVEDVARWVADATFQRGDADLHDQAVRSARSVVLNIAEGCGKPRPIMIQKMCMIMR